MTDEQAKPQQEIVNIDELVEWMSEREQLLVQAQHLLDVAIHSTAKTRREAKKEFYAEALNYTVTVLADSMTRQAIAQSKSLNEVVDEFLADVRKIVFIAIFSKYPSGEKEPPPNNNGQFN